MSGENTLLNEYALSNLSALPYYEDFRNHRERLTARVVAAAGANASLCVLGAGNCFDLDLAAVTQHYAEVHLVDIDAAAVQGTVTRQNASTQQRLVVHGQVDLSGLHDRIDRWAQLQVTPEELMSHAERTSRQVGAQIGRCFDVVLSACMLSQMHLSLLSALSDAHPLFQAASWTLNLTHFRTLAHLTRPGGAALFVTDVSAAQVAVDATTPTLDCLQRVQEVLGSGRAFDFADPTRLQAMLAEDPILRTIFPNWTMDDAWVWNNGPVSKFLVYASTLPRAEFASTAERSR